MVEAALMRPAQNPEAGKTHTIAVRVVDVFGNDAAGTVVVKG